MRTLIAVILSFLAFEAVAMRCGGDLVLEGDSVAEMLAKCGQPNQSGQNIIYLNKDGDGMNYYIHSGSNGIIDNITESR